MPIITYTGYTPWRERATIAQSLQQKMPLIGLPSPDNSLDGSFFLYSTALLASQVCSNLCYNNWAMVALSHQGM